MPILKLERWLAFLITAPCFGARLTCLRVGPGGCAVMQMPASNQCLTARWFAIMGMVWPCCGNEPVRVLQSRPGPREEVFGGGKLRRVLKVGGVLALILAIVFVGAGVSRLNSFSKATSGKGLMTSEISDRAGDGKRFNLLVLGYGGKKHEGANLTDSILVYSISHDGGAAAQISVPRDLWVEAPVGSGQYRKVNSAYANAIANRSNPRTAANLASKVIGQALGVPIHGWLTVDFTGFRDLVDALGGVEVDVQRTFTARYPGDDDATKNTGWQKIKFEKGQEEMDGERAIQYARARYSANPVEGSDFGRAARQQRLVNAIKRKLLSPAGIVRGFAVSRAVEDEVRTNVSAGDLARIFRQRADEQHSVVLSTQNVLVNDVSTDGQSILLPEGGDYTALHRFVRARLEAPVTAGK